MTGEGAQGGFDNEDWVRSKFRALDADAQKWLIRMGIDPLRIKDIQALKGQSGFKPDVVLKVRLKDGTTLPDQNISVKLVSQGSGFNQLDRGYVRTRYRSLWPFMPEETATALEHFTGELPARRGSRDPRRMFLDELEVEEKLAILSFLEKHQNEIVEDLFAGREPNKARFLLYVNGSTNRYVMVEMPLATAFFSEGSIGMTPRGSIRFGRLTAQRKGGDGGKKTANQLQFKFDPTEIELAFEVGVITSP